MTNDGTHGEAAPLRLPWRWLLPSAIVSAATLIVGIVLYGWMPGRLPTRFGPGGWPEAWSDKSVGSVFGTVVIQVLVLVVIVLAGAANLRPRSGHTPRLSLVQALFVLAAGVQLTLFLASLAVWTVLPPGGYLFPLVLLPTAAGLVVQLVEGVHASRKARSTKRRAAQKGMVGRAADHLSANEPASADESSATDERSSANKPSTAGEVDGRA